MSPPESSGPPSPAFLITIDTEGDNLWTAPSEITTKNAAFLPRFQRLAEKYGLKPTYLTNYEMANSQIFIEFARDALARGTAELGMHLHAWNSPPLAPLTADDGRFLPYLIEYPATVIREKVNFLTRLLEDTFGRPMRSHRAGRWAFNGVYARALLDAGYIVDTSVTPHVSWRESLGAPDGNGGSDYTHAPECPYFVDEDDVRRPGDSKLLEVPMTILVPEAFRNLRARIAPPGSLASKVWNRFSPPIAWLRPNGRNLKSMLKILRRIRKSGRPCAVFMLHSSELMPGGSPYFPSEDSVERLYSDLEAIFQTAEGTFAGAGLSDIVPSATRGAPLK